MLCDFSKFKQINNSYDLSWFLGVDHHNFKRLIRHMISNKECTIMDKKSVTGMRYHPPHSNRSMHVYKLTENQVRFLVTRQSCTTALSGQCSCFSAQVETRAIGKPCELMIDNN